MPMHSFPKNYRGAKCYGRRTAQGTEEKQGTHVGRIGGNIRVEKKHRIAIRKQRKRAFGQNKNHDSQIFQCLGGLSDRFHGSEKHLRQQQFRGVARGAFGR